MIFVRSKKKIIIQKFNTSIKKKCLKLIFPLGVNASIVPLHIIKFG